MKPLKTYYKGELVKAIFILPNPLVVDINVGNRHQKAILKSELMISLVDAENQFKELEDKLEKIKEIL